MRRSWRTIGIVVDGSVTTYRQHAVFIVLLALACIPLGSITGIGVSFLASFAGHATGTSPASQTIRFLAQAVTYLGTFGLGNMLLLLGVAQRIQPRNVVPLIPQFVLLLAVLCITQAALVWFDNDLILIIRYVLFFSPLVLLYHGTNVIQALHYGVRLSLSNISLFLNVIFVVWIISTLATSTTAFGIWLMIRFILALSDDIDRLIIFVNLVIANGIVASCIAASIVQCYLYVVEQNGASVISNLPRLSRESAS
jgi:hypothetical protein